MSKQVFVEGVAPVVVPLDRPQPVFVSPLEPILPGIPASAFQERATKTINAILKRLALTVAVMLLLAGVVYAGVVTQTVVVVDSPKLPITGDTFQTKIGLAVYGLCNDVSNLIVAVNGNPTTNATLTLTALQTAPWVTNTVTVPGVLTNTYVFYASGLLKSIAHNP